MWKKAESYRGINKQRELVREACLERVVFRGDPIPRMGGLFLDAQGNKWDLFAYHSIALQRRGIA